MRNQAINIPSKWESICVKEISNLLRGVSYKKSDSSKIEKKGYLPILRSNNINEKILCDDLVYVPIEKIKPEQLIKSGDVIIAMSSGSKHLVGKAAQANTDIQSGFGAFCGLVRPNKLTNSLYFGYFFQSSLYRESVRKHSSGVNINNLRRSHVEEILMPIPPLPEQHRIVSKIEELFTSLDAGIESLKQVQALLKKYRQSVLKSAVEGKLTSKWHEQHKDELEPADKLLERILKERKEKWEAEQLAYFKAKGKKPPKNWQNKYKEPTPPDTSNLPELSEGWVWCKLAQISQLITKGSSPRWQGFEYVKKGIIFIRSQNVGWGELNISDVAHLPKEFNKKQKKSILKKGDVLLNIVGASIGRAAIAIEETENANINQAVALIRLHKGGLLNTYLMNYLISADAQSSIHSKAVDVARANFSLTDISELPVPISPCKEQIQISNEIERLSTIIEKTENLVLDELKRSQSLRQSILKQAFEGKLVPQDPNDEPASVLLERIKAEKSNPKKSKQMEMF